VKIEGLLHVRTVAIRWVLRQLAGAHGALASLFGLKDLGRKRGPFVGAIAPGLVVGTTARAPRVGVPLEEVLHDGGLTGRFGLIHDQRVEMTTFKVISSRMALSPRLSKNEPEP